MDDAQVRYLQERNVSFFVEQQSLQALEEELKKVGVEYSKIYNDDVSAYQVDAMFPIPLTEFSPNQAGWLNQTYEKYGFPTLQASRVGDSVYLNVEDEDIFEAYLRRIGCEHSYESFSPEQLDQIAQGANHGLAENQVIEYASPFFTERAMDKVRTRYENDNAKNAKEQRALSVINDPEKAHNAASAQAGSDGTIAADLSGKRGDAENLNSLRDSQRIKEFIAYAGWEVDFFNDDQLKQIDLGLDHGLTYKQVASYAHPQLPSEQMEVERIKLEEAVEKQNKVHRGPGAPLHHLTSGIFKGAQVEEETTAELLNLFFNCTYKGLRKLFFNIYDSRDNRTAVLAKNVENEINNSEPDYSSVIAADDDILNFNKDAVTEWDPNLSLPYPNHLGLPAPEGFQPEVSNSPVSEKFIPLDDPQEIIDLLKNSLTARGVDVDFLVAYEGTPKEQQFLVINAKDEGKALLALRDVQKFNDEQLLNQVGDKKREEVSRKIEDIYKTYVVTENYERDPQLRKLEDVHEDDYDHNGSIEDEVKERQDRWKTAFVEDEKGSKYYSFEFKPDSNYQTTASRDNFVSEIKKRGYKYKEDYSITEVPILDTNGNVVDHSLRFVFPLGVTVAEVNDKVDEINAFLDTVTSKTYVTDLSARSKDYLIAKEEHTLAHDMSPQAPTTFKQTELGGR